MWIPTGAGICLVPITGSHLLSVVVDYSDLYVSYAIRLHPVPRIKIHGVLLPRLFSTFVPVLLVTTAGRSPKAARSTLYPTFRGVSTRDGLFAHISTSRDTWTGAADTGVIGLQGLRVKVPYHKRGSDDQVTSGSEEMLVCCV